jgi:hypothetical protein
MLGIRVVPKWLNCRVLIYEHGSHFFEIPRIGGSLIVCVFFLKILRTVQHLCLLVLGGS